jgi:hypothetical protein
MPSFRFPIHGGLGMRILKQNRRIRMQFTIGQIRGHSEMQIGKMRGSKSGLGLGRRSGSKIKKKRTKDITSINRKSK